MLGGKVDFSVAFNCFGLFTQFSQAKVVRRRLDV